MKRKWTIAIDGPAGAGKSTVAKKVANKLKIKYIDSGAVYRAITWKGLEEKIDLHNKEALIELTKKIKIELKSKKRVLVDNKEVTREIRKPIIDQNISVVAKNEGVRKQVVNLLQELSLAGGVIMEGRDITTVVLPHADIKFYLDADMATRANRRYKELLAKKEKNIELQQIEEDIQYRDNQDKTRAIGPLRRTNDAIYIDTSKLTINEVVSAIIKKIKEFHRQNWQSKLYLILYIIAQPIFRILFNFRVIGQENVPLTGSVLIASNHVSYADPPSMGLALPREAYFVAKTQLFNYFFLRWFFKKIEVIPIKQAGVSPQTFRRIWNLLKEDKVIVLFPEGQRSYDGKLQPAKPGIGMIISKAIEKCPQVKLIPAKILGTDKVLPRGEKWIKFHHIEVRFGKPIDIHQFANFPPKEKYQTIADIVMEKIDAL